MNETVGGMEMLRGGVNSLIEYLLKTFTETWVEPVFRQLIKLEQAYETDQVILQIAASRAQIYQQYGFDQITDDLLNQELTTTVNVGMGATDPMARLERFLFAIRTMKEIMVEPVPGMNVQEVGQEIFARLGYKNGERFFTLDQEQEDPRVAQLMEAVQQLQAALEDKNADRQVKLTETQMKEYGQNQRKAADLLTAAAMKEADLMNPVVGENPSAYNRLQR
jgi:hypothetical protein